MTTRIRLGVIGAGRVYQRLYVPALARSRVLRAVALADPSVPDADFRDPAVMLEAATVDAVLVLSPPALHAEHVAAATAAGLPVLVEKPPALTAAGVDAWANPQLVTPAFARRYWPIYRQPFGPGCTFRFHLQTNPATWGALNPESPVRDLLPHAADLARWLSREEIASVEHVQVSCDAAEGSFALSAGGRFDWKVAHGATHVERLAVDGHELPAPGYGPVAEALRRLRRRPTEAVGAVAELLDDWARSMRSAGSPRLPNVADARACAAAIESVEQSAPASHG